MVILGYCHLHCPIHKNKTILILNERVSRSLIFNTLCNTRPFTVFLPIDFLWISGISDHFSLL